MSGETYTTDAGTAVPAAGTICLMRAIRNGIPLEFAAEAARRQLAIQTAVIGFDGVIAVELHEFKRFRLMMRRMGRHAAKFVAHGGGSRWSF